MLKVLFAIFFVGLSMPAFSQLADIRPKPLSTKNGLPQVVAALRKMPKVDVTIYCAPCDQRAVKLADAFDEAGWNEKVEPALQAAPGILITGPMVAPISYQLMNSIVNEMNEKPHWDAAKDNFWMIAIGPGLRAKDIAK